MKRETGVGERGREGGGDGRRKRMEKKEKDINLKKKKVPSNDDWIITEIQPFQEYTA